MATEAAKFALAPLLIPDMMRPKYDPMTPRTPVQVSFLRCSEAEFYKASPQQEFHAWGEKGFSSNMGHNSVHGLPLMPLLEHCSKEGERDESPDSFSLNSLMDIPKVRPCLKRQKTVDAPESIPIKSLPKCEGVNTCRRADYPSATELKLVCDDVQIGMRSGFKPALTDLSTGGAYFLRNRVGRIAAVFKPMDEEPFAANNPRNYTCNSTLGLKNGIPAGEAAIRECAAFLIDRGFSRVPPTALVKCSHAVFKHQEKIGSLQKYVRHQSSSEDFGPSRFNNEDCHRIMVLDIRLCNQDRHGGNILVCNSRDEMEDSLLSFSSLENCDAPLLPPGGLFLRRSVSMGPSMESMNRDSFAPAKRGKGRNPKYNCEDGLRLVPIDHGFCLPHPFAIDETELTWLYWPQAKIPFSEHIKEYITGMDVEEDCARLQEILGDALPYHCLLTLRIGTELLKMGVQLGLTAYEIGLLMIRDNMEMLSTLEEVIYEAYRTMVNNENNGAKNKKINHHKFMEYFRPALEAALLLMKERRLNRSVSC